MKEIPVEGQAMTELYAHSLENADKSTWQLLDDHLTNVAKLSSRFASAFDCAEWGRILGLLHDVGKAEGAFQRRLEGAPEKVDHSSAGAVSACKMLRADKTGNCNGNLMAYAIAGHHGGMPNGTKPLNHGHTPLRERLVRGLSEDVDTFLGFATIRWGLDAILNAVEGLPSQRRFMSGGRLASADYDRKNQIFAVPFFTRMMYSCLVDADYLDTEAFLSPGLADARLAGKSSLPQLLEKLELYMDNLQKTAGDTEVNRARKAVLEDASFAAQKAVGIFTMTVPTGGGKTLASMEFALRHAIAHGQSRVVVAIPFTSIVEQTASTLRDVFGDQNVLEHHSNYDFEAGEAESALSERLAVQNWDAPIIVTTNVQLFESLYSNRPGKCRKLHNVARSVIVLDEAQTIPDALLMPSLAALEELSLDYGTTSVLCTATQPALVGLWPFGSVPTEIVSNPKALESTFWGRAEYRIEEGLTSDSLAAELVGHHQVLCVVGTKRKAREVWLGCKSRCDDASEGVYHLSANMVPAHRSQVISEIRRRLFDDQRCIVVSTQLIEAGVDVDFPCVYREMAGIDSIIQAAGRCNRSGLLLDASGNPTPGTVHIFTLNEDATGRHRIGWLERMSVLAREVIQDNGGSMSNDLSGPFFSRRYQTGDLDEKKLFKDMCSCRPPFMSIDFERYAREYKIIEDETEPLFIPWGKEGERLLCELRDLDDPARIAIRLQRYSVSVHPYLKERLEKEHAIERYGPICAVNDACRNYYSADLGLVEPGEEEQKSLVI